MTGRTTLDLLLHLRHLDVQLWLDGERLRFSAPPGAVSAELRGELAARKHELLAILRGRASRAAPLALEATPQLSEAPASFAQQRLWFLDQLLPGNPVYVIPFALRLHGPLDSAALERAIAEIVRRHEALRTTFAERDGQPMQVIAEELSIAVRMTDLRHLDKAEREPAALRLARADAQAAFDLARGPLLRVSLLQIDDDDHLLLISIHHIIADGWSLAVFTHELAELYSAFSGGASSALPELPIQYRDFARWQRQRFGGEGQHQSLEWQEQLAYWRAQLSGELPLLDLPADRPRPAVASFRGSTHTITLPRHLTDSLHTLSRQHGATLFMTLLALFKAFLYRSCGQADVMVGTAVANRGRSEFEPLIGFFVNTLVLRTDLSGNPTVGELLGRARQTAVDAYVYQDVPFEELVRTAQPKRDLSYQPLFQVMFVLQNTPALPTDAGGLTLTPVELPGETAKFDLGLLAEETPQGLTATFEYSTDLFEAATIARMAGHWRTLLESACAAPETRLLDLALLTDGERAQTFALANGATLEYPAATRIHDLIEAQARRAPAATAVVDGVRRMTYDELSRRTNQLARHLRRLGVGPEIPVGICVEQSIEMLVGLLGIMKAGGAYVPIDPAYPRERQAAMLADSGARVLLVATASDQRRAAGSHPESSSALIDGQWSLVDLDGDWETVSQESDGDFNGGVVPDNLAYIIYTSGSTGRPKGVAVTHKNLVHSTYARMAYYRDPVERFLLLASLAFDGSVPGIFWTLCQGGQLVLPGEKRRRDPASVAELIATQRISHLSCLPSFYALLIEQRQAANLASLRTVIVAAEACPQSVIEAHHEHLPLTQLFNEYGPTEGTVWSSVYHCRAREPYATVPIGRPVANQQIYILDQQLQPVPVGVRGELYIGGAGVARGYHGRPDLTAERFVPNPFADCRLDDPAICNSDRLYRTGDLARFLPDGNIEFLGRADQQVKIRGFRIELGEIEAALRLHPAVREAIVLARDIAGEQRLVAYIVTSDELQGTRNLHSSLITRHSSLASRLRDFLRQRLPDYMLPAAFVPLTELPLTPNGKINRKALSAPEATGHMQRGNFVAPSNPVEQRIARIWTDLLATEPVGVTDDFFDLGGHSLLAVRLMARIEEQFGQRLPLAALFQGATVEQLAHLVQARPQAAAELMPIQPGGDRPPFFCVHPAGGGVLRYAGLARQLGAEQPFYALQARGVEGDHAPHTRIEDMAAHYITAIRTIQPAGPYLLGGWSLGGIVAFEMARMLRAQGEEIVLLALLDSLAPSVYAPGGVGDQAALRTAFLREARDRREVSGAHYSSVPSGEPHLFDVFKTHIEALLHYAPQPYDGRIVLLRSSDERDLWHRDPTLGWGSLSTKPLDIYAVPGDHVTMLEPPHLKTLAAQLLICIERAHLSSEGSE